MLVFLSLIPRLGVCLCAGRRDLQQVCSVRATQAEQLAGRGHGGGCCTQGRQESEGWLGSLVLCSSPAHQTFINMREIVNNISYYAALSGLIQTKGGGITV